MRRAYSDWSGTRFCARKHNTNLPGGFVVVVIVVFVLKLTPFLEISINNSLENYFSSC